MNWFLGWHRRRTNQGLIFVQQFWLLSLDWRVTLIMQVQKPITERQQRKLDLIYADLRELGRCVEKLTEFAEGVSECRRELEELEGRLALL